MGKTLRVEYNTLDLPISYSCQTILDTFKNVTEIKVAFLYDLAFPSTLNESNALAQIESNLLQDLALSYGLWNGVACDEVPNGGLYIVKLSSEPQDTPNLMLDTCSKLSPNVTETCVSYNGAMTFAVVGHDDTTALIAQIAEKMSSGATTAETAMRVSFLGTHIGVDSYDGGRDNLPPATNAAEKSTQQADNSSKPWTPIGVLLLVGLCIAFIGLMSTLVLLTRRRTRRKETDEDEQGEDDRDAESKN